MGEGQATREYRGQDAGRKLRSGRFGDEDPACCASQSASGDRDDRAGQVAGENQAMWGETTAWRAPEFVLGPWREKVPIRMRGPRQGRAPQIARGPIR